MNIITKSTRPLSNEERYELWQNLKYGSSCEDSELMSGWEIFCEACTALIWVALFISCFFILATFMSVNNESETRDFEVPMENQQVLSYSANMRI